MRKIGYNGLDAHDLASRLVPEWLMTERKKDSEIFGKAT